MVARDVPLAARTTQSAAAPLRFNMLGLHWKGSGTRRLPHPLARRAAGAPGARPTPTPAPMRARASRASPAGTTATSTGPAPRDVQFRHAGSVTRLRAYYLWSKPKRVPTRTAQLAGVPTIVTRSSWEADEKITRSVPHYAPALKLAVVHHTAGTNSYTPEQAAAIVRGIEIYHVKGNGWNDIGYNFLVDRFGTVYEGRAGGMTRNVIGAHALGFNTGTVGVALIGDYQRTTPSAAEQAALVRLLAWRLDIAHVDPLSQVVDTSAGNAKYRAGKVVTLRASPAIATPARRSARATAPTRCSRRSRSASPRPGCRSCTRWRPPAPSAARSASRDGSPRRCRGPSP